MIFDVLTKKLVDAGLGTPGVDIFHNAMGPEVSVGTMFRTPLTGVAVDPYIEGRHKSDIQVIVRHTDPVEGAALANRITAALLIEGPEVYELPGGRIQVSLFYPKSLPIQFPRLEGNGLEFSIHFMAAFVIQPAWKAQ